ncbi:MAG: MBL fold metallo-hydrolase [Candidatus Aminicenantes bacterium]|nr:MBL fold metallo-hydrolase [Candidatus Aminicenantes bacterium]
MKLQFLGANRQVTGSRYFLQASGLGILIECGMFQEREFRERNWKDCPVNPDRIDVLLLTHVHLDHCGLIPKFVREGYQRKILTTYATSDLLPILLLDSARIQEEDAAYKKKRHKKEKRKGPYPEIPLYTVDDAEKALPLVQGVAYDEPISLNNRVTVRFRDAGHILGSSMLELDVTEGEESRKIIFSGDIGQKDKPIVKDPTQFTQADYVVMETTYGSRIHGDTEDVETLLIKIINETIEAGGNIVIPTFAIERAQEIMFHLSRLVRKDKIPYLMIFLDSPMAVDATAVFQRHRECLDDETVELIVKNQRPFRFPGLKLVHSVEQSKAINQIKGSCIIMAGSGMCTGGRIKHHLIQNIGREESTILFVGYQAQGTLGRKIVSGFSPVRIHGQHYDVRARIEQIHGFSAHADRNGLQEWLKSFKNSPRKIFLTHGEEDEAESFARLMNEEWGWDAVVPGYQEEWTLD